MTTHHYHVIGGFRGLYMPDVNDVYRTKEEARQGLLWHYEEWQESIATMEEDKPSLLPEEWEDNLECFEVERSATQIDYLYQIIECYEVECLEELDDYIPAPNHTCPMCNCAAWTHLGILGNLAHYRCQACHWEVSLSLEEV